LTSSASPHFAALLTRFFELVFFRVTLDIIGLTAFGYAFDCVKGSTSEVRIKLSKVLCVVIFV
jgi:hypothetical protein